MAPKAQTQAQTQTQETPQAPGAFSGAAVAQASQGGASRRPKVVLKERDWRIEEREARRDDGKVVKFYDIKIFPGERGMYEILSDALKGAHEFATKHRVWVAYTTWVGRKRVTLVVGSGAILLRTDGAVPIARLKRLLEVAYKVNAEFDARDDSEDFNPPDIDDA